MEKTKKTISIRALESRRRHFKVIVVVLLALAIAACGGDGAETTTTLEDQSGEPETSTTASAGEGTTTEPMEELREVDLALSTGSVSAYGYFTALELGFYEEEGLDVNLEPTGGSSDVAQILAGNTADVGMGVPGAMLPAIEAGGNIYPFFTYAYGQPFDVVVGEDSDIAAVAELEGLTIGISSLSGGEVPILRFLLVNAGLDPEADVEIVAVGDDMPTVQNSLENDRIQAYAGAKVNIDTMTALGLVTRSVQPEEISELPAEGLLAAEGVHEDHDLLIGVSRATAKGQLVNYTNLDAAACVLMNQIPEEFTDEEAGRAALEAVVERNLAPQNDDGTYDFGFLDADGWNTWVDIFIQGEVISEDIDMSEYVVSGILESVNDFDQSEVIELANSLPTDC